MDWERFFSMGGYAFYVWTSYGLMVIILFVNVILPFFHQSDVISSIKRSLQKERA